MAALSTNYLLLCLIYNYLESSLASIRLIYRGSEGVERSAVVCVYEKVSNKATPRLIWHALKSHAKRAHPHLNFTIHQSSWHTQPRPNYFFSPNCVFQVHGKTHNLSDSTARQRKRERENEKNNYLE